MLSRIAECASAWNSRWRWVLNSDICSLCGINLPLIKLPFMLHHCFTICMRYSSLVCKWITGKKKLHGFRNQRSKFRPLSSNHSLENIVYEDNTINWEQMKRDCLLMDQPHSVFKYFFLNLLFPTIHIYQNCLDILLVIVLEKLLMDHNVSYLYLWYILFCYAEPAICKSVLLRKSFSSWKFSRG